jgi:site-specific DNA recombinase
VCLPETYDDGGFSGATIDRPALQRLPADIIAGRVDPVVVYKIDRLTRSLADFAKIVEILDARDRLLCLSHAAVQHDDVGGVAWR